MNATAFVSTSRFDDEIFYVTTSFGLEFTLTRNLQVTKLLCLNLLSSCCHDYLCKNDALELNDMFRFCIACGKSTDIPREWKPSAHGENIAPALEEWTSRALPPVEAVIAASTLADFLLEFGEKIDNSPFEAEVKLV